VIPLLAATPGATSTNTTWLLARDLGLLTFVLATVSVLFGLSTSTRTGDRTLGRGVVYDSHRALALLTMLALGGHIVFLALDGYAQFSIPSLLIPFTIWYRPLWSAFGIFAAYLLVAIYVSFYVRNRIGYKTWRAMHYATFGVFLLAVVHGLMTGTDAGATWSVALYAGAVGAVGVMLTFRLLRGANVRPQWAWLTEFGNDGATRLSLAFGTVLGALALTAVVLLTSGTPATSASDTAQVATPPVASTQPPQDDDRAEGNDNDVDDDNRQPALRRQSGDVTFTGPADTAGWRLVSPSFNGAELDVDASGAVTLIRLDTGDVLFQAAAPLTVDGTDGAIQTTLDGVGRFEGGYINLDGTYQVVAGQVSLQATVEVATPLSR
jgi:sulfoxide reductase heme-binding subunit YedZ